MLQMNSNICQNYKNNDNNRKMGKYWNHEKYWQNHSEIATDSLDKGASIDDVRI